MVRVAVFSLFAVYTLATPLSAHGQTPHGSRLAAVAPQEGRDAGALRLAPSSSSLLLFERLRSQEPLLEDSLRYFTAVPQTGLRNRRGVPLMVAGGVLFVAGAITGDDAGTILMLGGAVAGAYGAYIYFGG